MDTMLRGFVVFMSLTIGILCIATFYYFTFEYPDGPRVLVGYETECTEQFDRLSGCYEVPVYRSDRSSLNYPGWVEFYYAPGVRMVIGILAIVSLLTSMATAQPFQWGNGYTWCVIGGVVMSLFSSCLI